MLHSTFEMKPAIAASQPIALYQARNCLKSTEIRSALQEKLDPELFYRINRAEIVQKKFIFKNNEVRTAEINEDIAKILSYTKWFRGNKKGQTKYYPSLSLLVESEGFEPSSKQWFRMSSTCLFFDWFSCWIRTKTPKVQP